MQIYSEQICTWIADACKELHFTEEKNKQTKQIMVNFLCVQLLWQADGFSDIEMIWWKTPHI